MFLSPPIILSSVMLLLLMIVGILLVVHDILYHLHLVPGVGRELEVFGIKIHHGYVGLIMLIIGLILWFL